MRALGAGPRTGSLGLFLYHQLKSRIGALDLDTDPSEWEDARFVRAISETLNEIPGLEVTRVEGTTLTLRLKGEETSHTLATRPVIDSLRLVWHEFRLASGDH